GLMLATPGQVKLVQEVQDLTPRGPEQTPTYYDIPLLKPPVWKWEVPVYFFFGGLTAGAFLLARVAERFGGRKYRHVTRAGTIVAAASYLPCAPLLILDLGDLRRFHYMLRVFKPESPMNVGAWTMTAYGAPVSAAVLREWLRSRGSDGSNAGRAADSVLGALADAA